MRRIGDGTIFLSMFFLMLTGCASFKPVDLNPRIRSGQVVQRTDNVVVLFDKSASMYQLHGKPMVNQTTRLIHAKNVTRNMMAAIPGIKLNAGLRTFAGEETTLIDGMGPLVKEDYIKAVNSLEFPNGRSPLADAITAAGKDIRRAGRPSTVLTWASPIGFSAVTPSGYNTPRPSAMRIIPTGPTRTRRWIPSASFTRSSAAPGSELSSGAAPTVAESESGKL